MLSGSINELQLDIRHYNRWWRRLVNAYEVKTWWNLQDKLCDPYLSALSILKVLYKSPYLYLYLTLNFTQIKDPFNRLR